jgi:drug/metabolite transporter (DMT)-like permease
MGSWIVWLVLAAVLGVAEVMTATPALGLAVAAVVAAIVGGVGCSVPILLVSRALRHHVPPATHAR